jgi:hypothetical protein
MADIEIYGCVSDCGWQGAPHECVGDDFTCPMFRLPCENFLCREGIPDPRDDSAS